MKIDFDDESYIEVSISTNGKIVIALSAKNIKDHKISIINSVEITQEQFLSISRELNIT